MNIEAKKLSIIERFMKLKQEHSIEKLEALLTEIELDARATASKADIDQGRVRTHDEFSKDVKLWLRNKATK